MNKQTLRNKTVGVGLWTLASRLFGLVREALMVRYLGAGADAFITAYKIPNSLRKVFAEGALSAAFIPSIVQLAKQNKHAAVNRLITLGFLLFEGVLLALCILIFFKAHTVLYLIAPGWFQGTIPQLQIDQTVVYIRILISFILLLSMSALLTGPLQAMNHFAIPASAPVLLNIVFIAALITCITFSLPVEHLCYFILAGGVLQLIAHVYMYFKLGFTFERPTAQTWHDMKHVLIKFFPVLLTMSIMEINLFIDTSFASYLPQGSISYLYYANRFMQIPLGVFAMALSTILLPHFSRISLYAPTRLQLYLYESAKLILWVTIPLTFLLSFLSEDIFTTLFLSKKFTLADVHETAMILIIFLSGLFIFSLSKIILNMYYALHDTFIPFWISIVEVACNFTLNYLLVMRYGTYGLAIATIFSGYVRTALLAFFLHTRHHFALYIRPFMQSVVRVCTQLLVIGFLFVASYYAGMYLIATYFTASAHLLTKTVVLWVWLSPLIALAAYAMHATRKTFGIKLYFLE
jgi:putative peptidoglycan lipid II flippase